MPTITINRNDLSVIRACSIVDNYNGLFAGLLAEVADNPPRCDIHSGATDESCNRPAGHTGIHASFAADGMIFDVWKE